MKPVLNMATPVTNRTSLRALGMSILTVGLVACGGGSDSASTPAGGGAPVAAITISPANAQSIAGAALDSGMGSLDLGESLGVVGVETSNVVPNNRVLSRLTANAVKKIVEQRSAPESVTGVITILSCSGVAGDTASGTFSVDNFDGTTSAQVTFTNCKFDPSETTNGAMTFSNMVATASSVSGTVSLNLTTTTTGGPAVTVGGGFTFTVTGIDAVTKTTIMTGSGLTMTEGTLTETISNFNFTSSLNSSTRIYTDSANFTLASTALGGSVTFETLTALQTNEANLYPHTGVAHIMGAGSTSLHITILGNETLAGSQVRIDFDADGTAPIIYENTSLVTWATLNP